MDTRNVHRSSFRDPSGFVFFHDGRICRQVNQVYAGNYELLMRSGLYAALTEKKLLIPHEEDAHIKADPELWYKTIVPVKVPFISYPYEWCFSQLKDAALLTLEIQRIALEHGMSLKDASAYNIQFRSGTPLFIDTLSFEKYPEGKPWVAYRQFCQHFLAPLCLMKYKDMRLNLLQKQFIDGIPLDLASSLLPARTWFFMSPLIHVHLHARSQKYYSAGTARPVAKEFTKYSFCALLDSLSSFIGGLRLPETKTEWVDYYNNTNYTPAGLRDKKGIIQRFFGSVSPRTIWDMGANCGAFSRLEGTNDASIISFDIDYGAVERGYRENKDSKRTDVLPLVMDINNPSPSLGWHNRERASLFDRGPADLLMALALIHHIVIGNNVSFALLAETFHALCKDLVVEFVPKKDSQVQFLLKNREDIFPGYTQNAFEESFSRYFTIRESVVVADSGRIIYLMRKKDAVS